MATTRTITKPILDLYLPSMGQPFNSTGGQIPSPFNDIVAEINGIDQAGWVAAFGQGSTTGGQYRPLIGDWGKTYTHRPIQTLSIEVPLPPKMQSYSLCLYARGNNPSHEVGALFTRGATSQALPWTTVGTNARPFMLSGLLVSQLQLSGGQMESITLTLRMDKHVSGSGTGADNFYWDGIFSYCLKFFR